MLSSWHDLLFLFCLLLFYLFLPVMGWLCGVGVFGQCPHSLSALYSGLQNNNNNKVDDKAVFVSDDNAHHSEWLESVSPTDQHGVMVLIFLICQVVSSC